MQNSAQRQCSECQNAVLTALKGPVRGSPSFGQSSKLTYKHANLHIDAEQ